MRELPLHDLHVMISVVLQDVYLFNTSIRENIRLGRPDASDTEVMDPSTVNPGSIQLTFSSAL